jgi:hypothetical protein
MSTGTLPKSWAEYRFPEWVPERLQRSIKDFWREEWGRSPRSWLEGAAAPYNHHPEFGTEVRAKGFRGDVVFGRWVPLWNNIGALVLDDGTVVQSSTCRCDLLGLWNEGEEELGHA